MIEIANSTRRIPDMATKPTKHKQTNECRTLQFYTEKIQFDKHRPKTRSGRDSNSRSQDTKAIRELILPVELGDLMLKLKQIDKKLKSGEEDREEMKLEV